MNRKHLSMLLVFCMLLSLLPVTSLAAPLEPDENTPMLISAPESGWIEEADTKWYTSVQDGNEYSISTPQELAGLAKLVNDGTSEFKGTTVKLTASIDLDGKDWTPIGNADHSFQGTFEGNQQTISNLSVNAPAQSRIGLFGAMKDPGKVQNLTLTNVTLNGRLQIGAVCGSPYTATYDNIKVNGLVQITGMSYVGGMLGYNFYGKGSNLTMDADESSFVKADSTPNYRCYVGGIVGFSAENGTLRLYNVSSDVDVYGTICDVGGISGIIHYGNTFENVSCSGDVYMTAASQSDENRFEIGGIAGTWHNESGKTVTLKNCSFTGKLHLNAPDGTDMTDTIDDTSPVGSFYKTPSKGTGDGTLMVGEDGKDKVVATNGNHISTDLEEALGYAKTGDTIWLMDEPKEGLTVDKAINVMSDGYGTEKLTKSNDALTTDEQDNIRVKVAMVVNNNGEQPQDPYCVSLQDAFGNPDGTLRRDPTDFTVKLLTDLTENVTVNYSNKPQATLDLNGHTLTGNITAQKVNLHLTDSSEDQTGILIGSVSAEKGQFSGSQPAVYVESGKYHGTFAKTEPDTSKWLPTQGFEGSILMRGGLYNEEPQFPATGYIVVDSEDPEFPWTVVKDQVARIGETTYSTLQEALNEAEDGATVTLLKDVQDGTQFLIKKNLTLDLNGHTYHSNTNGANAVFQIDEYEKDITVTVQNGTVINAYEGTDRQGTAFYVGYNNTLVLDNVKASGHVFGVQVGAGISAAGGPEASGAKNNNGNLIVRGSDTVIEGKTSTGIAVFNENTQYSESPSTVTIEDGTITGAYYGISGNGGDDQTVITMSGGTVTGADCGIYQPQDGDITVSGGEITGATGIQINGGGKLTISGGTISGTGEAVETITDADSSSLKDGAALSIRSRGAGSDPTNYSENGYGQEHTLDVSITGGTLRSDHNPALRETRSKKKDTLDTTLESLLRSISIQGGTFISGDDIIPVSVGSDLEQIISGGAYSASVRDLVSDSLPYENRSGKSVDEAPYTYSKDLDSARASARETTGAYRSTEEETWHAVYAIKTASAVATVQAPEDAFNGDHVSFTVKPEEGFSVLSVTLSGNGIDTTLTPNEDGTYSFEMPEEIVTIRVSCTLSDVEDTGLTAVVDAPVTEAKIADGIEGLDAGDVSNTEVSLPADTLRDAAKQTLKDHTAEEARGKLGDFADESDDVYVHVVTKIEVEVLDYDTTGEYVLDITPVYEVIASTEQDASKVDLDTNAVELQEPTKFDVQKAATIVIPVPREFAGEGDYIQVTHDHNGNLSYYTVPVENRQIRFTDRNGFSLFTLRKLETVELDSLTVSDGTLTPSFVPGTKQYSVSVDNSTDSLTITPEAAEGCTITAVFNGEEIPVNDDGTITVSGLAVGSNTITVTVSHNGTQAVYTLTVERASRSSGSSGSDYWPQGPQYDIVVEKVTRGTLTADRKQAREGERVTITAKAERGFVLDSLVAFYESEADDEEDESSTVELDLTEGKNANTWYFRMPKADVTVEATFVMDGAQSGATETDTLPFEDVLSNAWYFPYVNALYRAGLIKGISETEFSPNGTTTRAQLATMLYRMAGSPSRSGTVTFQDVPAGAWYYDAIAWASDCNLVTGYSDAQFGPEDPITREQLVTLLARYAAFSKGIRTDTTDESVLDRFIDQTSLFTWARAPMSWAVANGLVNGVTVDTLQPQGTATRAQIATIMVRYIEKIS